MSEIKSFYGIPMCDTEARKQTELTQTAFTINPVDVGDGELHKVYDGTYYRNPFSGSTAGWSLYLYDVDGNPLEIYDESDNVVNRMDSGGNFPLQTRDTVEISGTSIVVKKYLSYETLVAGQPRNIYDYHTSVSPAYIKTGNQRLTLDRFSDEELPTGLYWVKYNDTTCLGFLEQVGDYIENYLGESIHNLTSEFGKRTVQETVRQINQTRSALRIGTYNIYGAGHGQNNWETVKSQLQDFGLDICAFQEVRAPLSNQGNPKVFADTMRSWQFQYFSDNGDLYPTNERVCASSFPVTATTEYRYNQDSSDHRYLAKHEIQLSGYQDRVGSEQVKMSIYNTQLEVSTVTDPDTHYAKSNSIRLSEAQQILDDIAIDKNPFIAICLDTNDFSYDKEVWKLFENAGLTRCINDKSQTVRDQNDIIDQIFVNENMRPLNSDVVNSKKYTFVNSAGNELAVSDHDLCFADIQLLWDNFYCIKQTLEHVTSDFSDVTIEPNKPLTIHFTPESGYTITSVSIRMGWNPEHVTHYSDGVFSVPAVTGDVQIKITATANE